MKEIDPVLLSILACPEDHGTLHYLPSEQLLLNPRSRRIFRVRDGIPVMLLEESSIVDAAEFERLMAIVGSDGSPDSDR